MIDIVRKNLDAFGAADWDAYSVSLHDEVSYEEPGAKEAGRDAVVAKMKRWKTAFPDAKAQVVREREVGDEVIAEVTWLGTHTGPLQSPMGILPPSGQGVEVPAVIICRLEGGKIREIHHYFDLMVLLAQIGALEGLGIRAAQ